MPKVPGRAWPQDVPFNSIDDQDGGPWIKDGFVCELRPGDFRVRREKSGYYLDYECPREPGRYCGSLPIATGPKSEREWKWDGNMEKPTLSPSINCVDGCGWHGHLKAGVWED